MKKIPKIASLKLVYCLIDKIRMNVIERAAVVREKIVNAINLNNFPQVVVAFVKNMRCKTANMGRLIPKTASARTIP